MEWYGWVLTHLVTYLAGAVSLVLLMWWARRKLGPQGRGLRESTEIEETAVAVVRRDGGRTEVID